MNFATDLVNELNIDFMTYHINVKNTNNKEFLQIINSLRSLGVIESFRSTKDLVEEGEELLTDENLLEILENSKQEIESGNSFTMEEVKNQMENWRKR